MGLLMAQAVLRASETAVAARFKQQAAKRGQPITPAVRPAKAYVNWGRWVADCECGASMAVHVDWADARCTDCLTVYMVLWPGHETRAVIEALLLARPVLATRNWIQTETLADLVAENLAHGLPVVPIPEGEE
jgi:hypothetical protein